MRTRGSSESKAVSTRWKSRHVRNGVQFCVGPAQLGVRDERRGLFGGHSCGHGMNLEPVGNAIVKTPGKESSEGGSQGQEKERGEVEAQERRSLAVARSWFGDLPSPLGSPGRVCRRFVHTLRARTARAAWSSLWRARGQPTMVRRASKCQLFTQTLYLQRVSSRYWFADRPPDPSSGTGSRIFAKTVRLGRRKTLDFVACEGSARIKRWVFKTPRAGNPGSNLIE